jgi:hypothetical protein
MPGIKTLAVFRTDMESQLGNRGFGTLLVDQWVNSGYLELCGGIRFPELQENFPITTVVSTAAYAGPTNSIGWESVYNSTAGIVLERISRHDLFRRSNTNGVSDAWTRDNDQIILSPPPDTTNPVNILYYKQPTLLVASTDVTVIPAHWDYAIELLAVSKGLLHAVEEDRSAHWRNLAIQYIQSRLTEEDFISGRFQPVPAFSGQAPAQR